VICRSMSLNERKNVQKSINEMAGLKAQLAFAK